MPEPVTTGARQDAVELLSADHREVEQLFSMMDGARSTGSVEDQRRIAQSVVHALSVHAVAEEELLYPLMRRELDEGDELADDALEEHQRAKELLARIDGGDPTAPDVRQAWDELVPLIRHHVEDEEGTDFPQLRRAVDGEHLYELGDRLANAKAMAPTHPHPGAPNQPPANIVAGGVAAVVDKVRDALRR